MILITIEQNRTTKKYRITTRNDDDEIIERIGELDESCLEGLYHAIEDVLPEVCA